VLDFEVVFLPAQLFAQHSVGFIQLHKLAVQPRVGRVAVRMQLRDENVKVSEEIYRQKEDSGADMR